MKVQCPCGTKYAFDITPDMASRPFTLICQACQTDLTSVVRPLVDQELAAMGLAASAPTAPISAPAAASTATPRMRVAVAPAGPSEPPPSAPAGPAAAPRCQRHSGAEANETCRVCSKPICPQCMVQFGYLCSAFCQARAENEGIAVPEFKGQFKNTAARTARLFKLGVAAALVLILAAAGGWSWFEFVLSQPRSLLSSRFEGPADAVEGRWVAPGAWVLLKDGRLSRWDLRTRAAVWTVDLVDTNSFLESAREEATLLRARLTEWRSEQLKDGPKVNEYGNPIHIPEVPSAGEALARVMKERLDNAWQGMRLLGTGTNVWVARSGGAALYGWPEGARVRTVDFGSPETRFDVEGEHLKAVALLDNGDRRLTRLNLATGEVEQELMARASNAPPAEAVASVRGRDAAKGAQARPPAEPVKVSNRRPSGPASGATLPTLRAGMSGPEAAIAAIQLRSNTRLEQALADDERELGPRKVHKQLVDHSRIEWRPTPGGMIKFSASLVEFRPELRKAMKDAPKKSALDGPVGMAQTTAIANEIVNDMRRDATDGKEVEDMSPYRVTVQRPGGATAGWSGERIGPPDLYVLQTLMLLVAHTRVIALDMECRVLWETQLAYPLSQQANNWSLGGDGEVRQASPFIERGTTLYLIDPGVVSALDRQTGAPLWRLPSVGVAGLVFDPSGAIYVNTTTMGQEQVRYSQQVDISRRDHLMILKVEGSTGKVLWRASNCGHVAQPTGRYLYSSEVVTSGGGPLNPGGEITQLLLYRLDPKSGKILWEHARRGAPVALEFQGRDILVLNRESMDVLSYWAW